MTALSACTFWNHLKMPAHGDLNYLLEGLTISISEQPNYFNIRPLYMKLFGDEISVCYMLKINYSR